ncbi:Pyridine nucleotide-disulfide oxidoreductase, FAD/NAD(P)-binding domain protein [Ascosphaera apis ARSEF 7405]|uniref:Pyridine nucleotide-disulfide oxidoreductase, FAD/NAD(P)-binding domain protein n=1 Tax=Ascosphaera apis ARSEF 7405 TaxID=392613 RepID=A0A168DU36_9EURO|nr:Pyridine nucleotide-disulfide oxidoreductase, FAD/NAD(P)-binding domain protein [Ascosphaera apis ARSEF 7405]
MIYSGSGAIGCLEALVNNGYPGKISLISSPDQTYPIDRTKLSKALITEENPILLRNKEWYTNCKIDVHFDTVKTVDFQGKTVFTEGGKEYQYSQVVVATGGKPKALPLPGFSPENAFLLRAIRDAKRIVDAVGDGNKKIVVIGTSFIGMEVGNALSKNNDVTMVGMSAAPMDQIMGEKVGKIFQSLLEKSGAKFQMNAAVERLSTSEEHPGKKFVHIKDRKEPLEADIVVIGVGVSPATELIPKDAVRLLDDGSLKVDHHFQIDGLSNAYAIGDIATYPYWGPGSGMKGGKTDTRIEHWDVAQNAGKAAGDHIVHQLKHPGTKLPPKEFVPIFWSALGQQLRYCGNTINGYDDVILQGNPDEAKFVAYYTLEDTVVAVASMGSDPVVMKCVNLMKARKMPSKKQIQDGVNVLELKV